METNVQPYVIYMTSQEKKIAIDPASQGDPFYRYKTRQLIVQTIGNGKMIRTSFINVDDVAKDLKVPPEYIPHFLAKSIGAQAKYDGKKPVRQKGSISGEYPIQKLSDLFVKFIKEFILCPQCRLPELDYKCTQSTVRAGCRGCGWKGKVEAVENNEKFKRYVLAHPPPKPQKRNQKSGGSKTKANGNGTSSSSSKKNRQESSKNSSVVWLTDTSEEASKERLEQIPDRLKELVVTGEEDASKDNESLTPLEQLKKFVATKPMPSQQEVLSEISRLRTDYSLDKKPVLQLAFNALLSDMDTMHSLIQTHHVVFQKLIGVDAMQQAALLSYFEDRIKEQKNQKRREEFVNKKAVFVLKAFYDNDVLEEETILNWYDTRSEDDKLSKAIEPFITWLQEAEEEEEEEEEGEDSDEGDNSKEALHPTSNGKDTNDKKEKEKEEEENKSDVVAVDDDEIDAL